MVSVETAPVVSVDPVPLPAPGRGADLRVRVSAPVRGAELPIILFAHGFGSSGRAYGPLADHWAAAGFVVLQPTFRDSRTLGPIPDDPLLWRYRVEDMLRVLDNLEAVAAAVPGLPGRLDPERIAAAGHSFGGQTAGVLLGLRVLDPATGDGADLADERVRAGVLLATAGRGGADLNPAAAARFPWLNPDFSHLTAPVLVVAGDADSSSLTTRGPDWLTDPYHLSPGARALLTLPGAEHSLGGIPGYDAAETTDADPARVRAVQTLSTAFLRSALHPGNPEWEQARAAFADPALGRIEIK
ncbi:alpha/beta hydrolase family protein [Nocardia sp. NPDC057353]|uniref:alpha/beta hydrolase family protein n=1 Tax=Nocardia sp. NPDC057353 TaxID=3346104 RepID=UPI0036354B56